MDDADLRLGDWHDALADVECGALIVDAPYSARTHRGHDDAARRADKDASVWRTLPYAAWTGQQVREFVDFFAPRTRGWIVSITDHVLWPEWEAAMAAAGRCTFAPVPWLAPGSRVRLAGDGPACWTCWIAVSRPRDRRWHYGALPGAYVVTTDHRSAADRAIPGAKPVALMEALVRDYSRPGDLVCDPCVGSGTTLIAALRQGRRAVGAELDPETHRLALARIDRLGRQRDLLEATR